MAGRREQLVGLGQASPVPSRPDGAGWGQESWGGCGQAPRCAQRQDTCDAGQLPPLRGQLASEGVHIRSLGGAYLNFDL